MQKTTSVKIEFIVLMALLMSIVALSIDALLPALPYIGIDLGVTDLKKHQQLITMIFLGLGFGQLLFGPLSDSYGRKPMVYIGFSVFAIGSFICVTTKNFELIILGRILQGIGLSSPRTISIAMVRDLYSGDYMAKLLSIIVMFFILIPIIAPSLGQFILNHYNWKAIFNFNLIFGFLVILWFALRQPETLTTEKKIPFKPSIFISGTKAFFKQKKSVAFTLISGFITGSFMVYLSTSQHIFQVQYELGELFPYVFASTAFAVGFATFSNSQLVMRFGSFNIAFYAAIAYFIISLLYVMLFSSGENPHLYVILTFFLLQFFAVGFLFGNLRSLAMEPLGHIAGIGAAINGFISTILAVPIADYIGSFVTTSALPLFIGFTFFGLLSVLTFIFIKQMN
ncbi:multidrug effflux MFS transporter [Aurantibacter sp.]|uniref:multidrug effflux MFS transporter n=1 Tax=Aurantibacter sp. TaxID=2807103 RepID=UPI0035C82AA2